MCQRKRRPDLGRSHARSIRSKLIRRKRPGGDAGPASPHRHRIPRPASLHWLQIISRTQVAGEKVEEHKEHGSQPGTIGNGASPNQPTSQPLSTSLSPLLSSNPSLSPLFSFLGTNATQHFMLPFFFEQGTYSFRKRVLPAEIISFPSHERKWHYWCLRAEGGANYARYGLI